MSRKTAEELMEDITNFVNVYGMDKEGFKKAFRKQHRTLQQSTMRLFLEVIEMMAEDDYPTDPRNEGAKKTCQALVKNFKASNDGYPPSAFLGHI